MDWGSRLIITRDLKHEVETLTCNVRFRITEDIDTILEDFTILIQTTVYRNTLAIKQLIYTNSGNPVYQYQPEIISLSTMFKEVKDLINKLNLKKVPGADLITGTFLQHSYNSYNYLIKQLECMTNTKISQTTRSDSGNTKEQIHKLVNKIAYDFLDKKTYNRVFLALEKVFNKIPHDKLIQNLQDKLITDTSSIIRMCFEKMRRLYEKRLFQQILLEEENLRKEWKRFELHDKEITEERSKRKN
ncbi:hypothetical protein HZH68_013212 [Vespula germanica]|uniref:Uncharacterized protein n=1 Tax=Vespula germanica TaxID=30212 RepID=A0A834JDN5_VESGE|nr:hypothetical protein HZH68_013212 [Vespula germanica]